MLVGNYRQESTYLKVAIGATERAAVRFSGLSFGGQVLGRWELTRA